MSDYTVNAGSSQSRYLRRVGSIWLVLSIVGAIFTFLILTFGRNSVLLGLASSAGSLLVGVSIHSVTFGIATLLDRTAE